MLGFLSIDPFYSQHIHSICCVQRIPSPASFTTQLGLCGTKVVCANTELKLRDEMKLVLPIKLKYIPFMYLLLYLFSSLFSLGCMMGLDQNKLRDSMIEIAFKQVLLQI